MDQELGKDWAEIRERMSAAVRAVCPSWLADRREDLIQTATLSLLKNLRKTERSTPIPSSYLRRVAYNALVDEIRCLRRRRETPLEVGESEEELGVESMQPTPHQDALGTEIGGAIRDCLGRLVPPRRRAVTLYLLGHKIPEIVTRFGWSRKRTENLIYRGLDNLKACLREKGLEP